MPTKKQIDEVKAEVSAEVVATKAPKAPKAKPKAPKKVEQIAPETEKAVAKAEPAPAAQVSETAKEKAVEKVAATELETLIKSADALLEAKDYAAAQAEYQSIATQYPMQIEGWQGVVKSATKDFTKYNASCLKPMQHVHSLLTDTNRKAISKQYRLFLMNDDDLNLYGKSHIVLMILSLISFGMGVALLIIAKKDCYHIWQRLLPYLVY